MAEPMVGERIRTLHKSSTYTQDDLAAAAEVSVDVIRKLEQGRRHTASIGTLQRIARALDVDGADAPDLTEFSRAVTYARVYWAGRHGPMAAMLPRLLTEAAAAEVARTMPRDSALPLVSRCRHLADVAHAQLRLGHDRAAESTLLTMERAAPEWTRQGDTERI